MILAAASLADFGRYGFLGRALVAGLLLAGVCGLLSPVVVMRRLSFSADGLAHASLGGLAVGLCLLEAGPVPGLGSYAVAFAFTCVVGLGIAGLHQSGRLGADTAVGACYVAAFALGVLLLSWRQRYTGHLEHFFFGTLLAVQPLECRLLGLLAVIVAVFVFVTWRPLACWSFDEDLARASGVPVDALRAAVLLLLSASVVLSVKVVGLLLVTSLLILPGALGTLIARRMVTITALSLTIAFAGVFGGLVLSNAADTPPGPAIVLIVFALFLAGFVHRHVRDHRRARERTSPKTARS